MEAVGYDLCSKVCAVELLKQFSSSGIINLDPVRIAAMGGQAERPDGTYRIVLRLNPLLHGAELDPERPSGVKCPVCKNVMDEERREGPGTAIVQ